MPSWFITNSLAARRLPRDMPLHIAISSVSEVLAQTWYRIDNLFRQRGVGALSEIGEHSRTNLFDLFHGKICLFELANRSNENAGVLSDNTACKAAERSEHPPTRPNNNSMLLSKIRRPRDLVEQLADLCRVSLLLYCR